MTLKDFISEKICPIGFRDTLMRRKAAPWRGASSPIKHYYPEEYSEDIIDAHCNGAETLAVTAINGAGFCRWVGFDIDGRVNDTALLGLNETLVLSLAASAGHEAFVEKSTSYGSFHLWIIFETPKTEDDAFAYVTGLNEGYNFSVRPGVIQRANVGPFYSSTTLRLPGKNPKNGEWAKMWIDSTWVDVREMI